MTPAVALTSQSLDPVQAFAAGEMVTVSVGGTAVGSSYTQADYTGEPYNITYEVTGGTDGATYAVWVTPENGSAEKKASITDAGEYTITITAADANDVSAPIGTPVTFTINKVELNVTGLAQTYNAPVTNVADYLAKNVVVAAGQVELSNESIQQYTITPGTPITSGNTQTIPFTLSIDDANISKNYKPAASYNMVVTIAPDSISALPNLAVTQTVNGKAQVISKSSPITISVAAGQTAQEAINAFVGTNSNLSITYGDTAAPSTLPTTGYQLVATGNNININGIGAYTGTLTYPYKLVYTFDSSFVKNNVPTNGIIGTYNGNVQVPTITVQNPADKTQNLVEGTDYTVTYQQGKQANQAVTYTDMPAGTQPTNAGLYQAVVTYGETKVQIPFQIAQANFAKSAGIVTVAKVTNQTWTGSLLTLPEVAVTANLGTKDNPNNVALKKDVDYTVAFTKGGQPVTAENFIDAGEYTVTVTGKGNYTNAEQTQTFVVETANLNSATIEVTNADKLIISDGVASVKPEFKVTLNGKVLAADTYTVTPPTIANVVDAQGNISRPGANYVYTITPNGSQGFTGTKTVEVSVLGSVDLCDVALANNSTQTVKYGAENSKKPAVQVTYQGKALAEGKDYSITYGANTGAGEGAGTYTVKGIGNGWGGTYEGSYTIEGVDASIQNVVIKPVTFNGTVQNPADFITFDLVTEDETTGEDVVVDPSTYTYTITTNHEFKNADKYIYTIKLADCEYQITGVNGNDEGNITISPADLSKLTVTPSQDTYLVTTDKKTNNTPKVAPEYTITLNGAEYKLTANDFAATYKSGNTDVTSNLNDASGKVVATLTGAHNFTGTATAAFNVYQNIANLYPTAVAAVTYNGQAQTPAVKLFVNKADAENPNTTATPVAPSVGMGNNSNINYTVAYVDNVNAGTGKIVITGTPKTAATGSTYAGTLEIPFTINKAAATIAVADIADVTYTGSAITPEPKATITAGTQTVASTFAYSYANNVNAGTATVTVVPTGVGANYDVAATTKTFKINAANMSAVAYSGDTKVAVGKQPTIKLTYNGKELVAGTDYDVTETPVTSKAGKATLKVTGKGNFTGVKTIDITVEDASTPVNPDKPTTTEGWKHNATGWWYETGEGSYVTSAWKEINGNWYYFNKSGYMMTGWQKINGTWYYLNKKGEGTEGAMVSNAWKKINGTWYHFAKSGAMQTGWQKINGAWYYMAASGAMQTGWVKDGGTWYYLLQAGEGTEGKMVANQWKQINGSWFYFYASGAMAANAWVGNYYVDANGYWVR